MNERARGKVTNYLLSKMSLVNCFHTTVGFRIKQLNFTVAQQPMRTRWCLEWREANQSGSVCCCICVLSVRVHLLLWKKDDGSKKRMNTVSMD